MPIAQFVVSLAMVPQAVLFGALGTIPFAGIILVGDNFSLPGGLTREGNPYLLAVVLASLSVDAAAILCLASAIFLIRTPSKWGIRLSIAGAICYCVYIVGHLLMISTLLGGLRIEFTLLDAVDFPIGTTVVLVAYALYSYEKATAISKS